MLNFRFCLPILVGLALLSSLKAKTLLDSSQVLQFDIAKEGLTRISIDKDGIEDLYAYPVELRDNIQHHKSGHVLITACDVKGPLYLTLITKRGIAQDLKLIPTAKKAEPILLSLEEKDSSDSESIITRFIQGIIPQGFYPVEAQEVSREADNLEALLEKAYQNIHYKVLLFTVQNKGNTKLPLEGHLLWHPEDLALSFNQPSIDPDQTARLYVLQARKEGDLKIMRP